MPPPYATFDEWTQEIEGFSLRAERMTPSEITWASTAWNLALQSIQARGAFCIGDSVVKKEGYKFPGIVRSVFTKQDGQIRYVVECTVPETEGMLHIFREDQLVKSP